MVVPRLLGPRFWSLFCCLFCFLKKTHRVHDLIISMFVPNYRNSVFLVHPDAQVREAPRCERRSTLCANNTSHSLHRRAGRLRPSVCNAHARPPARRGLVGARVGVFRRNRVDTRARLPSRNSHGEGERPSAPHGAGSDDAACRASTAARSAVSLCAAWLRTASGEAPVGDSSLNARQAIGEHAPLHVRRARRTYFSQPFWATPLLYNNPSDPKGVGEHNNSTLPWCPLAQPIIECATTPRPPAHVSLAQKCARRRFQTGI